MELIKKFNSYEEYESFKRSEDYKVPNICAIENNGEMNVEYNSNTYFWIEALEDITVYFKQLSSDNKPRGNYSFDKITWTAFKQNQSVVVLTGAKLYIKNSVIPTDYNTVGQFIISGACNIGGNIMSLLYGDDFLNNTAIPQYCFSELFENGPIVCAHELLLPATSLGGYCCSSMFRNCKQLITAPQLPILNNAGYGVFLSMFDGCTSLTTAPALLTENMPTCEIYNYMFANCTNLSYIKALFKNQPTLSSQSFTKGWVSGVSTTGTFIKHVDATWSGRGISDVPTNWTIKYYDPNTKRLVTKFSIANISYRGADNITWEEWLASEDGSPGFYVEDDKVVSYSGNVLLDGVAVKPSDIIQNDVNYTIG